MTADTLHGHIALVTGGSRGIGAAIVRSLAEAGIIVALKFSRARYRSEYASQPIGEAGGHAIAVAADVSQADAPIVRLSGKTGSDRRRP